MTHSLETLLSHDSRFVRLVADEAAKTLGSDGTVTVERALRDVGEWLGRTVAARTSSKAAVLHALLLAWDVGDLAVGLETGWSHLLINGDQLELTLSDTPALRHFYEHGVPAIALWYYKQLLDGVSRSCGTLGPTARRDGQRLVFHWPLQRICASADSPVPTPDDVGLLLRTTQARGALMAIVGQALISDHGSTGEYCLRTAISRFGTERGALLRAQVDKQGLEPDIATMIGNYDSGGHTSVWQWADGGELTAGRQFQDCTFCPFIPVWRELDAMEIGQIYDYEFHIAQFRAFNPAIRLRWGALQTRGDDHCAFRFTLPGA